MQNKSKDSGYKKLKLLEEIKLSSQLLKRGLGNLAKIDEANDFYYAPILLLSTGFERLIKCLLCLAQMDEHGNMNSIPFETKGRNGHDIIDLFNKLLTIIAQNNYSSKLPAARGDIEFLESDVYLKEIITLFSKFAQGGRYYNLDIVLNGASVYEDPVRNWNEMETAIFRKRKDLLAQLENDFNAPVSKEINRELIIVLEKFARALARLFVYADLGELSKTAYPFISDFLVLSDVDLGKCEYQ